MILLLCVAALLSANWVFRGVWALPRTELIAPAELAPPEPPLAIPVAIPGPRPEDCGLRSLYIVCRAAGLPVAVDKLREQTGTSPAGTTLLDLKRAAADLGFQVSARHLTSSDLMDHLKQPRQSAILFCRTNHFVAAVGVRNDRFLVIDPASAIQEFDDATCPARSAGAERRFC